MKQVNKDFEKNVRYYLDSVLKQEKTTENFQLYNNNPNKKFTEYIKQVSGDENYKFSFPMSIFWNLTSTCNFRCVHCLYNDTKYLSKNNLTSNQTLSLADELINSGVTYVVLSGGEIFMRHDVMDIVRKFKTNNVALRLLTNAALLDDELIEQLATNLNPYTDSISVSLDASNADTFKKIRQADAFDKIIMNIKKMIDKNIKVTIVCTVNTINYSDIVNTYLLAQELVAYNFIVGKLICYNDSHRNIAVSNEALFELYYKLSKVESKKTRLEMNFISPIELINIPEVLKIIENEYYDLYIKKKYLQKLSRNCHCYDRLAIDSDGTVYLCVEASAHGLAPLGNYKKNTINEIWSNHDNNFLFKQRKIENMVCNNCKYNVFCNSGCIVNAYLSSKDCNSPQFPTCKAYLL